VAQHNEIEELTSNPAWEEIKDELEKRKEVLLSELLKQDTPEAIEYNLITQLLNKPREMLEQLRADEKGGK